MIWRLKEGSLRFRLVVKAGASRVWRWLAQQTIKGRIWSEQAGLSSGLSGLVTSFRIARMTAKFAIGVERKLNSRNVLDALYGAGQHMENGYCEKLNSEFRHFRC